MADLCNFSDKGIPYRRCSGLVGVGCRVVQCVALWELFVDEVWCAYCHRYGCWWTKCLTSHPWKGHMLQPETLTCATRKWEENRRFIRWHPQSVWLHWSSHSHQFTIHNLVFHWSSYPSFSMYFMHYMEFPHKCSLHSLN